MLSEEEQNVFKLCEESPEAALKYVQRLKETAKKCEAVWYVACRHNSVSISTMAEITELNPSTVYKKLNALGLE